MIAAAHILAQGGSNVIPFEPNRQLLKVAADGKVMYIKDPPATETTINISARLYERVLRQDPLPPPAPGESITRSVSVTSSPSYYTRWTYLTLGAVVNPGSIYRVKISNEMIVQYTVQEDDTPGTVASALGDLINVAAVPIPEYHTTLVSLNVIRFEIRYSNMSQVNTSIYGLIPEIIPAPFGKPAKIWQSGWIGTAVINGISTGVIFVEEESTTGPPSVDFPAASYALTDLTQFSNAASYLARPGYVVEYENYNAMPLFVPYVDITGVPIANELTIEGGEVVYNKTDGNLLFGSELQSGLKIKVLFKK